MVCVAVAVAVAVLEEDEEEDDDEIKCFGRKSSKYSWIDEEWGGGKRVLSLGLLYHIGKEGGGGGGDEGEDCCCCCC